MPSSPFTLPILLIEDDADLRAAHQELLELAGFRVHCAADGREALAALVRVEHWGLILLDMSMPRMTGSEFLAHLDTRVRPIPLPIVVLSANCTEAPAGVLALEMKPMAPERLVALARAYCVQLSSLAA